MDHFVFNQWSYSSRERIFTLRDLHKIDRTHFLPFSKVLFPEKVRHISNAFPYIFMSFWRIIGPMWSGPDPLDDGITITAD